MSRPLTRSELARDYDLVRGHLRPAYDRLADAASVRRNPVSDEVSFPSSFLEDDLRKCGLL